MSNALSRLIDIAKKIPMSDTQREEQRIRFSYGSAKIENDRITEAMVREAAARIKAEVKAGHG